VGRRGRRRVVVGLVEGVERSRKPTEEVGERLEGRPPSRVRVDAGALGGDDSLGIAAGRMYWRPRSTICSLSIWSWVAYFS
jgi:hypothetical protein